MEDQTLWPTDGVEPADSGVASALVNAVQQVGGAVGLALLSTISASAATSFTQGSPPTPEILAAASVHGYSVAFYVAAGIFLVAAVLCGSILRSVRAGSDDGQRVEPWHNPALDPPPSREPVRIPGTACLRTEPQTHALSR